MKGQDQPLIESLRNLLVKGIAHTQEDLKVHLQEQGFEVNQSKISRLLRKVGAIKTIGSEGEVVYQLPWEAEPPSKETTINHLVIDIQKNETLIVVRTSPGSASLIARVLDYNAEKLGSLGSVAGDDTIFIVPKSVETIEDTLKAVKMLLLV